MADDSKDQTERTKTEHILEESEERTNDPATTDLDDDTVERRRSDDLVSDPETKSEL